MIDGIPNKNIIFISLFWYHFKGNYNKKVENFGPKCTLKIHLNPTIY